MAVYFRLHPDDLICAEHVQALVEDFNGARDTMWAAHKFDRPGNGRHVSVVTPIAAFKMDFGATHDEHTLRFATGFSEVPVLRHGDTSYGKQYYITWKIESGSGELGAEASFGWSEKAPFPPGTNAWPNLQIGWHVLGGSAVVQGTIYLGARTPGNVLGQADWITCSIYGVSPWR